MVGKVTNEEASKANITIDDFRRTVNTVNPKNKGYVRFVPDDKGGVKIAKVNNHIDFCISWRTNIDSAHNRTMREKFALVSARVCCPPTSNHSGSSYRRYYRR